MEFLETVFDSRDEKKLTVNWINSLHFDLGLPAEVLFPAVDSLYNAHKKWLDRCTLLRDNLLSLHILLTEILRTAALAISTPLSSTSSVCKEGGRAEEKEEEDRDKFDLIHRKREMVKNYGKKMFRKVGIIRCFAICGIWEICFGLSCCNVQSILTFCSACVPGTV